MGFFKKLLGGGGTKSTAVAVSSPADGDAASPAAPATPAPPVAIVILRHGMDVPDEEYLQKTVEAERPGSLAEGVVYRGLSQPRWFAKDEWMESGARIVADAYEKELHINPAAAGYWESTGPDGAKILVVFLRR